MSLKTSTNDSASIFTDGKLEPGIYKIQNIVSQTYVDIREHTKELCCRPATVLEDGKGLVGSCPHLNPIFSVIVIISGRSSLWVLDIPYAGYSIESHLFLLRTERGNAARTGRT